MLKLRLHWMVLLAALVLVGCGAGVGDQPDLYDPEPPPGGGTPNPFGGRLVAEGTGQIHTMDLSANGEWTVRLDGGYDVVAMHLPENELHVASTSYGAPIIVRTYNLDNFALKESFVWPDSLELDYGRVRSLAVSTDGEHLAAVMSGGSDAFLEIVNRQTKEVRFSGYLGMASTDMQWLTDDLLVFAAEFDEPVNSQVGGIVAASLDELANGSGLINLGIIIGFTEDDWAVAVPYDFAFSHDGSQLAYAYNSDIWVNSLDGSASHQLTTGPSGLVGPIFSPDGNYLAFVESQRYSLRDTFVIPNHRGDPVFVNGTSAETEAYVLEARTLVETMLYWRH